MRAIILAMLAMTTTAAMADEADDARRLAVTGRDTYWNCLAREYPLDGNRNMSEQDFRALIASACPSEDDTGVQRSRVRPGSEARGVPQLSMGNRIVNVEP